MKKLILFVGLVLSVQAMAQQPLSRSNCDITLAIQDDSGTNGVAVTYNPATKLYYTAFAGNSAYPLEIFDASGKFISTQEIGYDSRGLWYNPSTKKLEGISYDNAGTFSISLNTDGGISGATEQAFSYGMEGQTVAAFSEKKKSILFVEGLTAYIFKPGKLKYKMVTLMPDNYDAELNSNGPIYTGVKNYEIGLFEASTMTVHLFNGSSGKETAAVKLTSGTCGEIGVVPTYFRVSYCNNHVFLFDTDSRQWTGYKLF